MGDGHLNKCKDCTKKDARNRWIKNSKDPEWVEKERARGRDKYTRLNYRKKYEDRNLRKLLPNAYGNIARKLRQHKITKKGFEFHHWNYHILNSVFQLSIKAHKCIHRHMTFTRDDYIVMRRMEQDLRVRNKLKIILIQFFEKKDSMKK